MRFYLYPICLSFLLITFAFKSLGQGLCDIGGGGFDINVSEGCAPLTLSITNNVQNSITIGYALTYDGVSTDPSFRNYTAPVTYVATGNFTLLQYGARASGAFSACKQVKVYEAGAPGAQYSACGGGKVILTLTDDAYLQVYDEIEIVWGDGETTIRKKGDPISLEHTYSDTSKQPIINIRGLYTTQTACSGSVKRAFPVSFQLAQLNNIQIKTIEMNAAGSLQLTYAGVTAIPTQIKYSADGTNFTTDGQRSNGSANVAYRLNATLNPSQIYQLKLSSKDLCGGELDSDIATSMAVSGTSDDEKNVITWNKYPIATGFIEYELFRDGTSIKKFGINETTYTDADVQCGDEFEYYIVAKTQKITSISAPIYVKTQVAQPKPISEALVTVNGDKQILISAVIPGVGPKSTYRLTIERAEGGSSTFERIAVLQDESEFLDVNVKANELSYCYKLSYENGCGQKLPVTEEICSILLKNEFSTLNWTSTSPFLEAVGSYDVLQIGKNSGQSTIDNKLSVSYRPRLDAQSDLEFTFQIMAHSAGGKFQSLSNTVNFTRSVGVFVPDAFSPNGDQKNDQLMAVSAQLQSFSMTVLNRWGEVVFHSDDISQGWDGTINGANAPVGSYVYKVTFVDDINQKAEKSGTFMLLR